MNPANPPEVPPCPRGDAILDACISQQCRVRRAFRRTTIPLCFRCVEKRNAPYGISDLSCFHAGFQSKTMPIADLSRLCTKSKASLTCPTGKR